MAQRSESSTLTQEGRSETKPLVASIDEHLGVHGKEGVSGSSPEEGFHTTVGTTKLLVFSLRRGA